MLNVKIDTKEIFHVITPLDTHYSANMAEELHVLIEKTFDLEGRSFVINLEHVNTCSQSLVEHFVQLQAFFKDKNLSFVVCTIHENLKKDPALRDLFSMLNTAPTESEAWDIVQMEEIERELGAEPE